jgi:hypothetical protein
MYLSISDCNKHGFYDETILNHHHGQKLNSNARDFSGMFVTKILLGISYGNETNPYFCVLNYKSAHTI